MPFVLTGNLESDTMCRFWMAQIQQGGGDPASGSIWSVHRTLGSTGPADTVDPLSAMSLLPCDKSPTFIDTV